MNSEDKEKWQNQIGSAEKKLKNNMKQIILETLKEIACSNTGTCQINLQSESAQEMIANKLLDKLEPFVQNETMQMVEDIVLSNGDYVGEAHE